MKKIFIVGLMAFLGGCSVFGSGAGQVDLSDRGAAVAATAIIVETFAEQTKEVCGNILPGEACVEGALITTADRDYIQTKLFDALEFISVGNNLREQGKAQEGDDALKLASRLLTALRRDYAKFGIDGDKEE